MPHVDYESAWHDLNRRLRARPGWGTKSIHALMAEVAADNEVSEDLMARALRLQGGSLTYTIVPEQGAATGGQATPPASKPPPGPSKGDRDESEQHRDTLRSAAA